MKKLENAISTVFHRHYRGGLFFNGSKVMKMPVQNLFCLRRRHGMIMIVRNVDLLKMRRALAWLTQYLKDQLEISLV
jgi:hypothetical protein